MHFTLGGKTKAWLLLQHGGDIDIQLVVACGWLYFNNMWGRDAC